MQSPKYKKRYLKNIVLSWNWNWVPRWWRKVRLVQSCIFIPRSAVQDFLGLSSKSKISYHPEIEIESREGWGWANLALQIARRRRHAQLGQLAEKPHNCIYTGRYMIYVSYTCIYILISIYFLTSFRFQYQRENHHEANHGCCSSNGRVGAPNVPKILALPKLCWPTPPHHNPGILANLANKSV